MDRAKVRAIMELDKAIVGLENNACRFRKKMTSQKLGVKTGSTPSSL